MTLFTFNSLRLRRGFLAAFAFGELLSRGHDCKTVSFNVPASPKPTLLGWNLTAHACFEIFPANNERNRPKNRQ